MSKRNASISAVAAFAVGVTVCLGSGTGVAATKSALSGKPINAVLIDDNGANGDDPSGDATTAMKAAVNAINASGGIKGRPLAITVCGTQGDANIAGQCARNAVANAGNVAVVGEWSMAGDSINPVLEQAKMANIGLFPQALSDYSAPVNFPVSSGEVGIVGGMVILAADQFKAKTIGLAYTQSAAGASVTQLLQPVAASVNVKITKTTAVASPPGDVSSNVEAVASGTNAVVLSTAAADTAALVRYASQSGITIPFIAPANLPASTIKVLPSEGLGLYLSDSFLRSGPGYTRYEAQMSAAGDSSLITSLIALNSWVSVQAFVAACEKAPTISRGSILAAMRSMTDFNAGGLLPPLNFSKPSTALHASFPRLFNGSATFEKVAAGGAVQPLNHKFYSVLPSS
jgi:ABC-type branched-subunit amino acid transport system substrate-binding protein